MNPLGNILDPLEKRGLYGDYLWGKQFPVKPPLGTGRDTNEFMPPLPFVSPQQQVPPRPQAMPQQAAMQPPVPMGAQSQQAAGMGTSPLQMIAPSGSPTSAMSPITPTASARPPVPPPPPPTAPTASPSFLDVITDDPEAALFYGLLQGGLKTMAAGGTPGATGLSSIGAGMSGGITDVLGLQAAQRKARTDKELLGIKRLAAEAALAKARRGTPGNFEKLMKYRDTHPVGSEAWIKADNSLKKMGSYAPKADREFIQLLDEVEEIKKDPNWEADPAKKERVAHLTARINKQTNISDSPLSQYLKAVGKGDQEFRKQRAKKHSADLDAASSAMELIPSLNRLETQIGKTPYTGGFADTFDRLKQYIGSVGDELGWAVPAALRADTNMQLSRAQSNELVTALLKTRMGSRPSDRDLQFLISTLPGLGLDKEANFRLINTMRENSVFQMQKGLRIFGSIDKLPDADAAEYDEMKRRFQENLVNIIQRVKGGYKPSPRMKRILNKFKKALIK